MRICFHHNDNDGRVAGALVKEKYPDTQLVEVNYDKPFPVDRIRPYEQVFIVDFNPKPHEMDEILQRTKNLVFIDHHKTTPEAYKDYEWPEPAIAIIDTSDAGCVLTWKFLFPDEEVPYWIRLVGDRDTWTFAEGDRSRLFHAGSLTHDTRADSVFWKDLLSGEIHWEQVVTEGDAVLRYRENWYRDYTFSWGFSTIFEGYKCFAVGLGMPGSEAFGPMIDEYDICLAFVWNGNKWTVSLYSKTVDVGAIAKKYGGGGHKGAAGFPCEMLPFNSPQKIDQDEAASMIAGAMFDYFAEATQLAEKDGDKEAWDKGIIMGRFAKWADENGLGIKDAAINGAWRKILEGLYREAPLLPDMSDIDTT